VTCRFVSATIRAGRLSKELQVTTVDAARRTVADIGSVCRYASAGSAARWLTAFSARAVKCARTGSLTPADQAWARSGARFQPTGGPVIALPGAYTAGAREMYCRNVYLRTGLVMPKAGWVLDLGANHGLFSVWAAVAGARAVAVEAQQDFAPVIRGLAAYNGVAGRVHVETALAGGASAPGSAVGVLADDDRWAATSHGAARRPGGVSVPELMSRYRIDRVDLLKVDIEGGEFAVFSEGEDLGWLEKVDQMVMEVHPQWGDVAGLVDRLGLYGYSVELRDNAGARVTSAKEPFDYAYFSRPLPASA
jgi:FkbM family methyltransferase